MYNKHFSVEQIAYLRAIANGRYVQEITDMFNKKFNSNRKKKAISNVLSRNRIKTNVRGGKDTQFKKGQPSWNKGRKGLPVSPKLTATQFKKGNMPQSTLPVGSESVRSDNDTIYIKIENPNVWKQKHIYLYEQKHGTIPTGHCVIFLDGNKRNFAEENLFLVRRTILTAAHRRKLVYEDAALMRSGLLLTELLQRVNKKEKEGLT